MKTITFDEVGVSTRRQRKERACKAEGCATILNPYNKDPYCSAHKARRLLAKFDRKAQNDFDRKRRRWFRLSKWEEQAVKLDSFGLNFRHRQVRSEQQFKKKVYAVWVRD